MGLSRHGQDFALLTLAFGGKDDEGSLFLKQAPDVWNIKTLEAAATALPVLRYQCCI